MKRSGPLADLDRPEPKSRLNRPFSVVADDDATGREAHEREWERRRAAGAAGSVSLAAAGMSDGSLEAPEEVAVPATTLLGVEEGDDLPAEQPGGADAYSEAGDGDEEFARPGDGDEELSRTSGGHDETARADLEVPDSSVAADETTADSEEEPSGDDVNDDVKRLGARPLGQAPLLDSEPLPATRPGMLRPRAPEERDSFSLPVQRPAFELGSDEPADIV